MRAILVGLLLGVGVAVLYAPVSGQRTRSIISQSAQRLRQFFSSRKERLYNVRHGLKMRPHRINEELDEQIEAAAGM